MLSTRKLTPEDLAISFSERSGEIWTDNKGCARVNAHLKDCSFVNTIIWLEHRDLERPDFKAAVLLKLNRVLKQRLAQIENYLQQNEQ